MLTAASTLSIGFDKQLSAFQHPHPYSQSWRGRTVKSQADSFLITSRDLHVERGTRYDVSDSLNTIHASMANKARVLLGVGGVPFLDQEGSEWIDKTETVLSVIISTNTEPDGTISNHFGFHFF